MSKIQIRHPLNYHGSLNRTKNLHHVEDSIEDKGYLNMFFEGGAGPYIRSLE